jgi:phthiocerol/phenolphthiocerol synthesis type-I polyketide synthase C
MIFTDDHGVGGRLRSSLEAVGASCILVAPGEKFERVAPDSYQLNESLTEDFRRLLTEHLNEGRLSGIVYLWGLEIPPPELNSLASLERAQRLGCLSLTYMVQAVARAGWKQAPRLWVVTNNVHDIGNRGGTISLSQAPVWGLAKTVRLEHPELDCTTVDLGSELHSEEVEALCNELLLGEREPEVALRGSERFVARLARLLPAVTAAAGLVPPPLIKKALAGRRDRSFQLEVAQPGILDSLRFRATPRRGPGVGEVEIDVSVTGLNFVDVLKALNVIPAPNGATSFFGAECAGTVCALGEGVGGLEVGDEVVAIAPDCFGGFTTTKAALVVRKPEHLSPEEAATIPVAFATAYFALHRAGGLREGERVLIHAAAGGVGLAAVQIARQTGAEIFATAGSEEKREYLRSLGVEHVMSSRSLDFADEVMRRTGGRGVDVVLNSQSGEAMMKGLAILSPFGRFLEIGKRDIFQNGALPLGPFRNHLSYFAVDLHRLSQERPELVGALLRELMRHFEERSFSPLPLQIFPLANVADAFRFMAQARHVGKIVVYQREDEEVPVVESDAARSLFSPDGTYLITGGLGGLGLTFARWMADQGVRHLVLVSRSGPGAPARKSLEEIEKAGARLLLVQADVASEEQLGRAFAEIEQTMPPLRGVIHAAGVLDDVTLLRAGARHFQTVMAPKVQGAWNLHTLTQHLPLDFFVMCSSAASLFGSPGQGNYSAANAFLDALAHYRRAKGLHALSVNWGPWSEVGGATGAAREGRLAYRGVGGITSDEGVEALGLLLGQGEVQAGVVNFNLRQWQQFYPKVADSPLFSDLSREATVAEAGEGVQAARESGFRNTLAAAPASQRQSLVAAHLQEQIGRVLGLPPSELRLDVPLADVGLDSLMTIELRNRLEAALGLTLSSTLAWNYPTIHALSQHLTAQMFPPAQTAAPPAPDPPRDGSERTTVEAADLDKLSQEELAALLAQEIVPDDKRRPK